MNRYYPMAITLLLLLNSLSLFATTTLSGPCGNQLESLPIQQGGRVKPLRVHARESIKYLTGKSKAGSTAATTAYCQLSLQKTVSGIAPLKLSARIDHTKLRALFNLTNGNYTISYENLIKQRPAIGAVARGEPKESSYSKALVKIFNKIQTYQEITGGKNWYLYESGRWQSVESVLSAKKISAAEELPALWKSSDQQYKKDHGDHHMIEMMYSKMHLPHWSLLLVIIGFITSIAMRRMWPTLALCLGAIALQTASLTFRVIISGRAPITNMYETMLFSGYGALILAMVIGHIRKERLLVTIGLACNLCSLFMISFANDMLPSAIGPLVPVLRDNFWLSTHVTTIILSYAALALSWLLANTVLIRQVLKKIDAKDERYYADLAYACMKVGTVLLAAGIILGGVWADYSWGRFWGWDPKETWSLIALLIYMAIIHGKYTSWIPPKRFIPATAAAFMSVMMAWFGVNYILASGLHSYGFSQGGALFLLIFFLTQLAVIAVSTIQRKSSAA
jgi:cytochrome c-type biogenesis protein CcsB